MSLAKQFAMDYMIRLEPFCKAFSLDAAFAVRVLLNTQMAEEGKRNVSRFKTHVQNHFSVH